MHVAPMALLLLLLGGAAATAGTGAGQKAPKLHVHIVCHSHDDAGWLKTVDQVRV
jgi:diadenosine tetraphosphate (Ap4A) HIT family hydrolase